MNLDLLRAHQFIIYALSSGSENIPRVKREARLILMASGEMFMCPPPLKTDQKRLSPGPSLPPSPGTSPAFSLLNPLKFEAE
jgi:hypothetical protein